MHPSHESTLHENEGLTKKEEGTDIENKRFNIEGKKGLFKMIVKGFPRKNCTTRREENSYVLQQVMKLQEGHFLGER